MADLMPKNHDEVLVTFSDRSFDPPKISTRKLSLSSDIPTLQIGRSSSRSNINLSASPTNAWFDNAVMSRDHAEIIWDSHTQVVSIRDTGSLHGTSLNGFQIPPWTTKRIQVGDILKFGAPVEKEAKAFHPSEVQVSSIDLGPPKLPLVQRHTNTFTVPDDSEPDEITDDFQGERLNSDSDDSGVARSAMLLQESLVLPSQPLDKNLYPPTIDLTEDIQTEDIQEVTLMDGHNPSLPDQHPLTPNARQAPISTFAPASRFHEPSEIVGKFCDQTFAATAVEQGNLEQEGPEPSGTPERRESSALLAELDETTGHLPFTPLDDLTLELPSPPTATAEATRCGDITAESRQKIMERMAVLEHRQQLAEDFPRPYLLEGSSSDGFSTRQPISCGQKRKLSDIFLSDIQVPQVNPPEVPERPRTVNLALLSNRKQTVTQRSAPTSDIVLSQESSDSLGAATSPALSQVEPPRKRIRRVAEAMGYAALGGLAVMSALIATAPDL